MPRVHNPTTEERITPGFPAFAPGEVREVSDEDAVYLTNGSGIVLLEDGAPVADPVDDPAPKKRKPSSPDNT